MKRLFIIAALTVAALSPMRAQDFTRVNDTTWIRTWEKKTGMVTQYAYKADLNRIVIDNNNAMRIAGLCFIGGIGSAALAGASGLAYGKTSDKAFLVGSILFSVGALAADVTGCCMLIRKRVVVTPDGVVVRIGKTSEKYDNKKLRQ